MKTDISRKGLAMAPRYPFFAGAAVLGTVCAGVLAGFACAAPMVNGAFGAISAVIENRNVSTAVFFSSCFASLISIFWKYPERFSAVMKFATEFIEAEDPSSVTTDPFFVIVVSQRFSARETVLATSSSNS